jgi:hypothetical protein
LDAVDLQLDPRTPVGAAGAPELDEPSALQPLDVMVEAVGAPAEHLGQLRDRARPDRVHAVQDVLANRRCQERDPAHRPDALDPAPTAPGHAPATLVDIDGMGNGASAVTARG